MVGEIYKMLTENENDKNDKGSLIAIKLLVKRKVVILINFHFRSRNYVLVCVVLYIGNNHKI